LELEQGKRQKQALIEFDQKQAIIEFDTRYSLRTDTNTSITASESITFLEPESENSEPESMNNTKSSKVQTSSSISNPSLNSINAKKQRSSLKVAKKVEKRSKKEIVHFFNLHFSSKSNSSFIFALAIPSYGQA